MSLRVFLILKTKYTMESKENIIHDYLEKSWMKNTNNKELGDKYCELVWSQLDKINFLLFPKKKTVIKWDSDMIKNFKFKCDLLVHDRNFWSWWIKKEVLIDQIEHLRSFESLKSFLELQEPTIVFPYMKRSSKDKVCEFVRSIMLTWFEKTFWLATSYEVRRIWFDLKDPHVFLFNNWKLDLKTWKFDWMPYLLSQDTSVKLEFPDEEIKNIALWSALKDCLSIKQYISNENTISSLILWYMIAGIFRKEYKDRFNEFPFLWIEWYSGIGKTSLLNFLSWICWYSWNTINWVCDSDYAFEVWMDCMGWRFYFFDEIQKASTKLLKYVQAAYNSWENHKWGWNGNWSELQTYRKDCSLICTWELLPQQEEALLNRFIVLCPTQPFLVKKNVKDNDEIKKLRELTHDEDSKIEYLSTDQIREMGMNYYRPRFLAILKNKNKIKFNEYIDKALSFIDKFSSKEIDTRFLNNLSPALAWYLLLKWDDIDTAEIEGIISDYLKRLDVYRKDSIVSSRIVEYIISHIGEFCSRTKKVKGQDPNYPMIYLKHTNKERILVIQIQSLIKYVKDKVDCNLATKHIEQQFRQLLWIQKQKSDSRAVKVAGGKMNMTWVPISLDKIKNNESLRLLWDNTLSYFWEHLDELIHISSWEENDWHTKQPIQKCMAPEVLKSLINEIDETYKKAEFFDIRTFNKEQELPF